MQPDESDCIRVLLYVSLNRFWMDGWIDFGWMDFGWVVLDESIHQNMLNPARI